MKIKNNKKLKIILLIIAIILAIYTTIKLIEIIKDTKNLRESNERISNSLDHTFNKMKGE